MGPNAVRTHHAQPLLVLARQVRSPLLVLLAGTAVLSFFLGEHTDTVVIGVILVASVALSFANEYRAERASDALHSQISHRATTGDNAVVAQRFYRDLGLTSAGTLTGADIADMDDSTLSEAVRTTTISPE